MAVSRLFHYLVKFNSTYYFLSFRKAEDVSWELYLSLRLKISELKKIHLKFPHCQLWLDNSVSQKTMHLGIWNGCQIHKGILELNSDNCWMAWGLYWRRYTGQRIVETLMFGLNKKNVLFKIPLIKKLWTLVVLNSLNHRAPKSNWIRSNLGVHDHNWYVEKDYSSIKYSFGDVNNYTLFS